MRTEKQIDKIYEPELPKLLAGINKNVIISSGVMLGQSSILLLKEHNRNIRKIIEITEKAEKRIKRVLWG
ncbi:hypothetical protein HYT26_00950 [Candidatus Pacearchaeota archaeon]|nr:hypothetical protein [Candidatus Pacearchaeota archaeon]